ncbi:MAG: hypothetical protein L0Z50_15420 [Verrucomicrobiales bacterium]|nr:hypothetical protein [Verrucomicrobiales bacterium]
MRSTSAHIFDQGAERYDAWFDTPDGRIHFENELAAIRLLWRDEFVRLRKSVSARDALLRLWESSPALTRLRARRV